MSYVDAANDDRLANAGDEYTEWYFTLLDAAERGMDTSFWLAVGERAKLRRLMSDNGGKDGAVQTSSKE